VPRAEGPGPESPGLKGPRPDQQRGPGPGGPAGFDAAGPLEAGVRVSLELPDAGTCVGVVSSKGLSSQGQASLTLDLLDELPDAEVEPGSTLDLFMPRPEGIYHWLCSFSSEPFGQRAELELLGSPMVVQRRSRQRVDAALQAKVRRIRSARRGPAHEMTVADLSHGGMRLVGAFQLSTGDTVEVTVDLQGTRVQAVGRAVMAYPSADGRWTVHLSFIDGQREALDTVDSFLAYHLRGVP
jgi:PilZ domain